MPTAASSTDRWRAVADVGHLVRFRVSSVRWGPLLAGALLFGVLTVGAAVIPAHLDGAGGAGRAFGVTLLLPTVLAGFVLLAAVAAASSAGGRELLAREPAAIHPISPTTDHLGALLLAPFNVAWLVQGWLLLGITAFAVGLDGLVWAQAIAVAWILTATALGQLLAWALEAIRRTRHGILAVRLAALVLCAGVVALHLTDRLVDLLDRLPTRWVLLAMLEEGPTLRWLVTLLGTLAVAIALVVAGAYPAHLAARRPSRDEARVEAESFRPRRDAASDLGTLVRIDRGSVWRAVPMRRGLFVMALGPTLVALLGGLEWSMMTVLPGLVAAGGALLYGVNAWSLDQRGALWRESLPVSPAVVFDARAYVLAEFLVLASLGTLVVAGLRAGIPSPTEVVLLLATLVVVTVQVVGAAMRWSASAPYAVDLRSARSTPAPPAVMLTYALTLALTTTCTGILFSALAELGRWDLALLAAVAMLAWSAERLLRTRRGWLDPAERARVVLAVSA